MTGAMERDGTTSSEIERRPRSLTVRLILAATAVVLFAGFLALGTWQVYRLQWKLALIERVETRVHAAPVQAPGPERWPQITAASDEYRHVRLTGVYLPELSVKVQAATELGSGYWLLTPLRTEEGTVVLVNRGFIFPNVDAARSATVDGAVTVSGLLRISEPGGGFLRHNDPAGNLWYSRDVAAIAASRGLTAVAPYFVDADVGMEPPAANGAVRPVGGLTVIRFHNSHLIYALTWYALALMVAGAAFWVTRDERRARRAADRQHRGTEDHSKDGSHDRHPSH